MRTAKSKWEEAVLICRKCGKRAGGGFGRKGKQSLRKVLKKELGLKKGRRARIGLVEVDCLKLCPKNAVTVVLGSAPQAMVAVPIGMPVAEVVAGLGLQPAEPPRNEPSKTP
jgi:predicted metal-binding protein